ncbi:hypothetical protein CC1G_09370 [Coprinopsis cinerea okayama7|uniref:Uncharacterized protein n=1 Tax=Coprinopsis cinerea (strain Okayama-7 / 130 / ATCC MYA-4618 / FGSC 9003) TaxID=240176 RepID=A8NB10_COPC7|nr:hypothetical protein CC1G_09370 [Coprinopsis cinerea okayama7\|eukprot:XP_001832012.2 hypothetical protein CC1G_09370 [Coprinopsis cinerea okayama7\
MADYAVPSTTIRKDVPSAPVLARAWGEGGSIGKWDTGVRGLDLENAFGHA